MSNIKWEGVYTALLTPFTKDEELDFEMFTLHMSAQLKAGVNGLIIGGSLGEASTLTTGELMQLLAYANEQTRKAVPIIINIAEQSTKNAVRLAQRSDMRGADGLMLLPPMRYKAGDGETLEYLKTVATNTSLPIMIYNNPHDYGIGISLDMFEELSKLQNVEAVKESSRDVTNVIRMRNRFGDRFKILCGVDTIAMEELVLGADGWVAGLVNAFPEETVAIYDLVKAGKIEAAANIYRWFMPLLELDIHPKLVQYIKLAAAQTGLGTEYVRAPRLLLPPEEREQVLKIITASLRNRPVLEKQLVDVYS